MHRSILDLVSVQASIVLFLSWVVYKVQKYVHTRWRLSRYPLYNAKGVLSSSDIIPIHELHTSAKLLSDGFAKYGVSGYY